MSDHHAVGGIRKIVLAENKSKVLGITHAKFLVLLSVLANDALSQKQKTEYISAHKKAWGDIFYRSRARSVITTPHLRALIKP